MEDDSFRLMIRQVRAGDADAAARLVREFEPAIRRYVRVHLTDPRLRQVLDTMDVCQSVLANFFVRVALGQFDLEQPAQLLKLLATFAHNRVLNHVRDQQAGRRDQRRLAAGNGGHELVPDPGPSPSQAAVGRELLERVEAQLDAQERDLFRRRQAGQEWLEIAAELGGGAEALRKRLARALDRATLALGLDEVEEDQDGGQFQAENLLTVRERDARAQFCCLTVGRLERNSHPGQLPRITASTRSRSGREGPPGR